MPSNDSTVTIDGCAIKVMRAGSGAPLLYLHGASGAPRWLPFMEALAGDFDVIVPEHPGYGASPMPDWLDGVGDLAYFYLDLIEQLGLDGVNLVGTSMGGWIAAEMAIRNCGRIASMVLCAPAGLYVKGIPRVDSFMLSPEETIRHLVHDPRLAEEMLAQPLDDEQQMTVLKNRLTTAKLGWQPRMHDPDLPKWLHRVCVPTLVLWGEDDRLLPAGYGPVWRDLVPGARLATFAGCGHLAHLEKPDDYVATLTRFIREARP